MEILLIIKSILDKVKFHPLFYIIVIISLFTAHFKELIYFTSLILIHELGHSLTGIILGYKLNRIEIYPYGGCSKLEYDINIPLKNEILILIMGPIFQLIYVFIIYTLNINVSNSFYIFNKIILLFNLLPIYPLDGGKIINIVLNYFFSYYNSLKITIYFSYILFLLLSFFLINNYHNLTIYLIILSTGINIINEIKKTSYYYNKFLLERYLNTYNFKKKKVIKKPQGMKRNYLHLFIENNNLIKEKVYLNRIFTKFMI